MDLSFQVSIVLCFFIIFATLILLKLMSEINDLFEKVNQALDDIRPHLAVDGGNIELVEITADLCARVRWMGNCEFCSMSAMTMKAGVEQVIQTRVPEIKTVEAINGSFSVAHE
jgi:Fe-S cluster biogenesis protein NfuA